MKLYSRPLVRQWRRLARLRLRRDRGQWKLYRQSRKSRLSMSGNSILAPYFWFLVIIGMAGQNATRPGMLLCCLALYCFGTVFLRAQGLRERLFGSSGNLRVLSIMPVTDRELFRLEWRQFLRRAIPVFLLAFAFYLILGFAMGRPLNRLIPAALVAALLQWSVVIALTAALVSRKINFYAGLAPYILIPVVYSLPQNRVSDQALHRFALVLPGGWSSAIYEGLLQPGWLWLPWLLPCAAACAMGWFFHARMRDSYHPDPVPVNPALAGGNAQQQPEELVDPGEYQTPGGLPPAELPAHDPQSFDPQVVNPQSVDPQSADPQVTDPRIVESFAPILARTRIEQGGLRLQPDWSASGWLEGIAGHFLDTREKTLAEFMMADTLGFWSTGWKRAALITAVLIVAVIALPVLPEWLTIIPAVIAGLMAAPLAGGRWPGFTKVIVTMKQSTFCSFYPVGYWEISRMALKTSAIRLAAWAVLLLPTGAALGWKQGIFQFGLALTVKIFWLIAATQPLGLVLLHSQGTNDTEFSYSRLLALPLVLILLLGVLAAAITLFALESPVANAICGTALAAGSGLAWYLYGLFYNRGRVDLMRQPERR
jgi:hypothetical protein